MFSNMFHCNYSATLWNFGWFTVPANYTFRQTDILHLSEKQIVNASSVYLANGQAGTWLLHGKAKMFKPPRQHLEINANTCCMAPAILHTWVVCLIGPHTRNFLAPSLVTGLTFLLLVVIARTQFEVWLVAPFNCQLGMVLKPV
jgi:hypothetical protein